MPLGSPVLVAVGHNRSVRPAPRSKLAHLLLFLLTGLPAFGIAIALNIALVELTPIPTAAVYALVLVVQVTINFYMARRFVFDPSANRASLLSQYLTFLTGVAVVRVADWVAYVLMVSVGVFFVAAQLINVVVFSIVRFAFARRVIEGPAGAGSGSPPR